MENKYYIKKSCHIKNNLILVDNKVVFEDKNTQNAKEFLKNMYKNLNIKYPKFFKMDNLSKLAFLAAENLLETDAKENTALIFSNKSSSLDTDRKHQESINDPENYFPSPAVFVYTLPNICLGEISIRHQLKSENAFFVFNEFNSKFHFNYESGLLKNGQADAVLGGWVELDKEKIDCFLYLIENTGKIEYTEKNINKIYNNE